MRRQGSETLCGCQLDTLDPIAGPCYHGPILSFQRRLTRETDGTIKIQVPRSIKAKLDALRAEGTTASGLIRRLLHEFFGMPQTKERRK